MVQEISAENRLFLKKQAKKPLSCIQKCPFAFLFVPSDCSTEVKFDWKIKSQALIMRLQ